MKIHLSKSQRIAAEIKSGISDGSIPRSVFPMTIQSKEHYDLMAQFEQQFKTKPAREAKEFWKHSIYCDGHINRDFIKFREGYSLAKSIYQNSNS